jgi:IS1 family transposase
LIRRNLLSRHHLQAIQRRKDFIFDLTPCTLKHIVQYMKRLTMAQKTQVVRALVEGNSIRSTVRLTGVSKNTVIKLLLDLADACAAYHDSNVRNLKVRRLQCDEIWQYVGSKAKNTRPEKKAIGWGDVWTWTAIDADTKLCVSYLVGGRDLGWAKEFMHDCATRIRNRVQITTDGHKAYLEAVESAFGADIDYAQLQKIYGAPSENHTRYSPAQCIGCDMKVVSGDPDPKHVSTSFVERQNLSMRMSIRRFTRLTNAFSKKIENHAAAVALWFMYYNFCRVHSTLRVTPAMEAGICGHVWSIEELCDLLPENHKIGVQTDKALILKALAGN